MTVVVLAVAVTAFVAGGALGATLAGRRARAHQAELVVQAQLAAEAAAQASATRALAEVQARVAAERDAAVRAAIDYATAVQHQTLASETTRTVDGLDGARRAIDERLALVQADLHRDMARVAELVHGLRESSASQLGAVQAELRSHADLTRSLSATTQGLREALGNSKARGQWGERLADEVVRAAGMVEHVSYRRQRAAAGQAGDSRAIPDFTFLLPGGRVLHMDVKFPIAAYLRSLEVTSPAEQQAALAQFQRDVRQRVKELARRDYAGRGDSLEFVVMFIPNEGVNAVVHDLDPTLVDDALAQGVVPCSPVSLFALLGVIRQANEAFATERRAGEILGVIGEFTKQWDAFSGALDKLGERLASTQKAFDELSGTRRRQLQKPLDRLDTLRARREAEDAERSAGGELLVLPEPARERAGSSAAS
jgi:DNA recombination protein RmuC